MSSRLYCVLHVILLHLIPFTAEQKSRYFAHFNIYCINLTCLQLMLLRRFMTEILLETTDDELGRIVREQIEIAKRSGTCFQF